MVFWGGVGVPVQIYMNDKRSEVMMNKIVNVFYILFYIAIVFVYYSTVVKVSVDSFSSVSIMTLFMFLFYFYGKGLCHVINLNKRILYPYSVRLLVIIYSLSIPLLLFRITDIIEIHMAPYNYIFNTTSDFLSHNVN